MSDEVRVLIVEDHQMVAAAFSSMLETVGGFTVAGTASTFGDAVGMAAYLRPDLALVDYRLPDGEAADHIGRLTAAHPPLRVLVVTGWASDRTIDRVRRAGAHGLVSKSEPLVAFVSAIRAVAAGGERHPSPRADGLRTGADAPGASALTAREVEVLDLLSRGSLTSDIAGHLHLSVNTVRNHVTSILAKLGVHTRVDAVTEAMRLGIISPPGPVS